MPPNKREINIEEGTKVNPNLIPVPPSIINKYKVKKELTEKQQANVERLILANKERARLRAIQTKGIVEDVESMPRDQLLLEVKAKREYVKKTDEEKMEDLRQKVMNKKLQEEMKQKKMGMKKMPTVHEEDVKEVKEVKEDVKKDSNNNMFDMFKMFQQFQTMAQPSQQSQPIVINNAPEKKPRKRVVKKKFVSDTEDTEDTDFYTDTTEVETDYEAVKKTNYRLKKLQQIENKLSQYQKPPPPQHIQPRNPYSVFG